MDLLVPCIVEGRSELRNVGRVNCKTHWPFSGCGTPYSLNVYIALQIKLRILTSPAARSVESALFVFTFFNERVCTDFATVKHQGLIKITSPINSVVPLIKVVSCVGSLTLNCCLTFAQLLTLFCAEIHSVKTVCILRVGIFHS